MPAQNCRPSGAADGMRTGPSVWQLERVCRCRLLALGMPQAAPGALLAAEVQSPGAHGADLHGCRQCMQAWRAHLLRGGSTRVELKLSPLGVARSMHCWF